MRLFWGALFSAALVIGRRFSALPPSCNFDLSQDLFVFAEFFLGCCVIEAANWGFWYTSHFHEVRKTREKMRAPEDYTLSGGGILGAGNKTGAFLLGCGFVGLGVAFGPNPCTNQTSVGLSWISEIAALGAAYGMLLWGSLMES
jgi:hypothetical protein